MLLKELFFTRKLEEDNGATIFFVLEKQQKYLKQQKNRLFFGHINNNRIMQIMEQLYILTVLNKANDSRFMTRK